MDIAKAFTFITEDERWVGKIGIGALVSLLSFLIVPIPLLVGYMVGVTRNVMNDAMTPLPEWDDWGQLFTDGLSIIVAQLVYTLPFWLLSCIAGVAIVAMGGLAESNEDIAVAGLVTTFGLVGCLMLVFIVALFFLSPAIIIQYVRTNELGATFRFGEVAAIAKENIGNINHEAIYQRIYQDKKRGETLYRNLRCQKKRRKRYGSGKKRRGQIIGKQMKNFD